MSVFGAGVVLAFIVTIIFTECCGGCPLIDVRKNSVSAFVSAGALIFILTCSIFCTALCGCFLPAGLTGVSIRIVFFTLALGGLMLGVERGLRWFHPMLTRLLAPSLPLIGIDCMALGVVLLVFRPGVTPAEGFVIAFSSGAGFLVILLLHSLIRVKLACGEVPKPLRGVPIVLLAAGLISMALAALDTALLVRLF